MSRRRAQAQHGQALPVLVAVLAPVAAVALAVGSVARLVADQTRLQAAVDAAAYSAAALQADTLNRVAAANRTLAAHLVTTAQVTSAVAHLRVLARAARAAQSAGAVFPPIGPALGAAAQTADGAAAAATGVARTVVAFARAASAVETGRTVLALGAADARLAARARARLRAAAPAARFTAATEARLRGAALARVVEAGEPADIAVVARASLDPFSAGRPGAPPLGRTWQVVRAGKDGRTRVGEGGAVEATDMVGIRLVEGKGLGFSARVSASEFGHGGVRGGWRLAKPDGPPPLRLEATLVSVAGRRLTARAAAGAVYRRPGRPGERSDLFGPFWRPRLLPFRADAAR